MRASLFPSRAAALVFASLIAAACGQQVHHTAEEPVQVGLEVVEPQPGPRVDVPRFPIPPPPPSAMQLMARSRLFAGGASPTMGEVSGLLRDALASTGHTEIGFYAVPDGFAIATRFEQVFEDGCPRPVGRWADDPAGIKWYDWRNLWRHIKSADASRFRVLVLVVSPPMLRRDPNVADLGWGEATFLAVDGLQDLPGHLADRVVADRTGVTVLSYEYARAAPGEEPSFVWSSSVRVADAVTCLGGTLADTLGVRP